MGQLFCKILTKTYIIKINIIEVTTSESTQRRGGEEELSLMIGKLRHIIPLKNEWKITYITLQKSSQRKNS